MGLSVSTVQQILCPFELIIAIVRYSKRERERERGGLYISWFIVFLLEINTLK